MSRVIQMALFLTFCCAGGSNAAEPQQASGPEAKPSPASGAIPLIEIASKTQAALESLREIESGLSTDQTTTSVVSGLSDLTTEIESEIGDDTQLLRSNPSLQMLYPLKVTWQSFDDKLSAWNNELTRSGITLDEDLARLGGQNKVWQLTLQSAQQGGTTPEILPRVKDVIDSIEVTRQAVASHRAQVLALQNRALEEAGRIRKMLTSIEQAEAGVLKSALSQNGPPIWSLMSGSQEEWAKNSGQSFFAQLRALTSFAQRLPFTFLIHALIILMLALALHWFGRQVHKWSDREPSLQGVAPIYDLPVSTSLALSFLLTRWLLYSQAPRLLLAIIGALALIPTVLILRRLLDRNLVPILNAIVVMFFVDQLRQICASVPLLARVLLLAQTAGAILFLIWLIRRRRLEIRSDKTSKRLSRVTAAAVWLGIIVLSASILSNILGYVNLANLLASTFLLSVYLAAILYVAILIVDGLVTIALQVGPVASLRAVRLHRPTFHRRLLAAIEFLAFLLFLSVMLSFLGLRTPLIQNIATVLQANLTIGSLDVSLGHILGFVGTVWASFLFAKFLRFLLEEDVYQHFQLARGTPQAISTMVQYAVLLLGFLVAMQVLGVDLNKLTILMGAFTVGVGFGLQNIINNFVSGLILLFERPIKVGDVIDVGGTVGEVRHIGIRATVVRTPDGSEVIVPNGTLISNQVTNWTFSDQQRAIEIPVTVVRGTAPQRLVELLKTVAANHAGVAKQPQPQSYVLNFSSGTVTFQLRAWTNRYEDWVQVRSDLSVAVDEALSREGISIP
jgi:potassium-dependent mechanosensitive channel